MMKSTQTHCSAPSRKGKHINQSERQQIEYWRLKGLSVTEVATCAQKTENVSPAVVHSDGIAAGGVDTLCVFPGICLADPIHQ